MASGVGFTGSKGTALAPRRALHAGLTARPILFAAAPGWPGRRFAFPQRALLAAPARPRGRLALAQRTLPPAPARARRRLPLAQRALLAAAGRPRRRFAF